MKLEILKEIADTVFRVSKIFRNSFYAGYKEVNTSMIVTKEKGGIYPLLVNDNLNNYFYIRSNSDIKYTRNKGIDCVSYLSQMDCKLVAIVNTDENYQLLELLKFALNNCDDISIRSGSLNTENIIRNELSGVDKEIIQRLLKRVGNISVVSIDFTVYDNYPNLCKPELKCCK